MNEASNDDRSGLLAGKVALVVGASRGIGAVSARALARAGAKVMLAARDANALETVVGGIRRGGHEAHFVTVDIADESSVSHLIKCVLDRFGRLDVAFNNATDGTSPATACGYGYRRLRPSHSDEYSGNIPRHETPNSGPRRDRRRLDHQQGVVGRCSGCGQSAGSKPERMFRTADKPNNSETRP
jgi:hypothetical protein